VKLRTKIDENYTDDKLKESQDAQSTASRIQRISRRFSVSRPLLQTFTEEASRTDTGSNLNSNYDVFVAESISLDLESKIPSRSLNKNASQDLGGTILKRSIRRLSRRITQEFLSSTQQELLSHL
jgi:hypothetical protein